MIFWEEASLAPSAPLAPQKLFLQSIREVKENPTGVQVPEILHPLSTKRVLTMEFVTGANVCDKQALARMGLKPKDVARLVSETFNEMIFIFGDVSLPPLNP